MESRDKSSEVVGSEGLGTTVAAVAQQVSSIEKSTAAMFASVALALEHASESIRRETTLESHRLNALLEENASKSNLRDEAIRGEIVLLVEAIRRETKLTEEAQRREFAAYQFSLNTERQVVISKHDVIIKNLGEALRSEMQGIGDVAIERMARFMEVKELHWHEHRLTHAQEGEAIRVSQRAIDQRLDAANHLNERIEVLVSTYATRDSVDRSVGTLESRVERNEIDARRRDELKEAKINQLEKDLGIELRREVRPVQDRAVGQAAIWAAIIGVIAVIGVIVTLANYAAR